MKARFGSVWQPLGAFQTPTLVKRVPDAFLLASSRRGGLVGRVEQEASDTSIDSDVGSLLGRYLEIE